VGGTAPHPIKWRAIAPGPPSFLRPWKRIIGDDIGIKEKIRNFKSIIGGSLLNTFYVRTSS